MNVAFMGLTLLIVFILGHVPKLRMTDFSILLFWLLYSACVFYSPRFGSGLETSMKLFGFAVCLYFLARFYMSMPNYNDRFLYDVALSVVIATLFIGYLTVQGAGADISGRLRIDGGSPVGFSQMIDFAAALTLFYFLAADRSQPKYWRLAAILVFTVVMLLGMLNATRGTVLSLAAAATLYLALMTVVGKAGRIPRLFSVILLCAATVLFAALFVDLRKYEILLASVARLTTNLGGDNLFLDSSSLARLTLLRDAFDLFVRHPLTGVGIGGYDYHTGGSYPHNMFAELLAESGLIVTCVFAAVLGRFSYISLKLIQRRHEMTQVAMAVGLFMVAAAHQQVSFALWMAKPLFFAMGVVAALYYRELPQRAVRIIGRTPELTRYTQSSS